MLSTFIPFQRYSFKASREAQSYIRVDTAVPTAIRGNMFWLKDDDVNEDDDDDDVNANDEEDEEEFMNEDERKAIVEKRRRKKERSDDRWFKPRYKVGERKKLRKGGLFFKNGIVA